MEFPRWTLGAFSDSVPVALFFAVFSLTGLGLATANYWALTQTLIPGASIGKIVGIQNCAANLPGIVAPLLTGWLKQTTGSYEARCKLYGFSSFSESLLICCSCARSTYRRASRQSR